MTRNENEAGLIDVSKGSKTDANITLVEKRLVSGTISIPQGEKLTDNLNVRIYVENTLNSNDSTYSDVVIPVSGFITYNIYVPAGNSYIVRYDFLNENNNYVKDGYLGNSGMEISKSAAKILDLSNENKSEVNLLLIKKRSIKGTVSLPAGITLTSSIKVDLYAGGFTTSVTLLPDGKPVDYTLRVPPNAQGSGYKVYYRINTSPMFNETGYYSNTGMTSSEASASIIDLSSDDAYNIGITLMSKSSISGAIKLPSNNIAVKETSVRIYVSNNSYTSYQDVLIKEGTNSALYNIFVPAGIGYTVKYDISNPAYLKNGYYNANSTVMDLASADQIALGNENKTGIDLTLIGNTKIEGRIFLPNNRVAPANGLYVTVIATNGTTRAGSIQVAIPQNYKSVSYSMYVPPATEYKISYNVTESSYISEGFYNTIATTIDKNSASSVNGTQNQTDINLTLISKIAISGIISLPPGSEPKADVNVRIYAVSGNNSGYTDILIPNNTRSVPYTVYVPAVGDYEVRYEISSNNMYVTPGYYNSQTTTSDKTKTNLVKVPGDVTGIDMTIIPKMSISGTVFLKDELAPLKGIPFTVTVSKIDTSTNRVIASYNSSQILIPEGSNSAPYIVYVPSGKDYIVSYSTTDIKYISSGYHTSTETIRDYTIADKFDLTNGSSVGVNLTLIRKKEITGSIFLTKGTAPYGGLNISIIAENDKDSGSTNVIIPEGVSSLQYTVYVPEGSNYRVRYSFNSSNEKYLSSAYYNVNGSVRDKVDASIISALTDNKPGTNINIIPLYLISGTISLPAGVMAPTGGLKVNVYATSSRESIYKQITIYENNNGSEYKLYVYSGLDYKVSYTISDSNYLSGYYNVGGTVLEATDAKPITVSGEDIYGINMAIIEKKSISGNISLPDNYTSSGPVSVQIYASSAGNSYSTRVDIPKDKKQGDYIIKLPPNKPSSGYLVYYTLITSNEEFISKAY
ncbi:MAG: hypothetical protein Q8942_10830, partial [Bacillota bacterium]|nr:hypothetical protein [Bacillota bacterium]